MKTIYCHIKAIQELLKIKNIEGFGVSEQWPKTRYLLERGPLFNSSQNPDAANPFF
jgi:hypothetical protein